MGRQGKNESCLLNSPLPTGLIAHCYASEYGLFFKDTTCKRERKMNVLTRVLKAAWDEANKPYTYVNGDEFELFVRTRLFPKDLYDIEYKTHDYADNKRDYIASSKMPDFKLDR